MKQIKIGKKKLYAQVPTKIYKLMGEQLPDVPEGWPTVNTSNTANTQAIEICKSKDRDKVLNR